MITLSLGGEIIILSDRGIPVALPQKPEVRICNSTPTGTTATLGVTIMEVMGFATDVFPSDPDLGHLPLSLMLCANLFVTC